MGEALVSNVAPRTTNDIITGSALMHRIDQPHPTSTSFLFKQQFFATAGSAYGKLYLIYYCSSHPLVKPSFVEGFMSLRSQHVIIGLVFTHSGMCCSVIRSGSIKLSGLWPEISLYGRTARLTPRSFYSLLFLLPVVLGVASMSPVFSLGLSHVLTCPIWAWGQPSTCGDVAAWG